MKKNAGFTLMELMVVIAIIGILSAIAIPNAISWRNNAQINSAARAIYSDLQSARSTAVRMNMRCTVLFDADTYTIFIEDPVTSNLQLDSGERVLKSVDISQYGGVSIGANTFPDNGAGNPAITFWPTGFAYDHEDRLASGDVVINGTSSRKVFLTAAGNVRIENYY